jgi:hypothetical protein
MEPVPLELTHCQKGQKENEDFVKANDAEPRQRGLQPVEPESGFPLGNKGGTFEETPGGSATTSKTPPLESPGLPAETEPDPGVSEVPVVPAGMVGTEPQVDAVVVAVRAPADGEEEDAEEDAEEERESPVVRAFRICFNIWLALKVRTRRSLMAMGSPV